MSFTILCIHSFYSTKLSVFVEGKSLTISFSGSQILERKGLVRTPWWTVYRVIPHRSTGVPLHNELNHF